MCTDARSPTPETAPCHSARRAVTRAHPHAESWAAIKERATSWESPWHSDRAVSPREVTGKAGLARGHSRGHHRQGEEASGNQTTELPGTLDPPTSLSGCWLRGDLGNIGDLHPPHRRFYSAGPLDTELQSPKEGGLRHGAGRWPSGIRSRTLYKLCPHQDVTCSQSKRERARCEGQVLEFVFPGG